jgi:transcriptional regulator with XRE-family HTH domain
VPSPSKAQLGAALRRLREGRGESIEALAAAAGLHWTYLSKIERGVGNPTWAIVGELAEELEIEVADLAKLAGEMPS